MKSYFTEIQGYEYSNPLTLFFCGHEKCNPSHSFGPAIRPHYLIHYILKGKGVYYENGHVHTLKAGNGFLITPGQITTYTADSSDPWEYCWIGFDGYEAETILKNCGLLENTLIFYVDNNELGNCLLNLNEVFHNLAGNEYTYLSYLYQCFSCIMQKKEIKPQQYTDTYLKKAIEYFKQNYSYPIKIADVAKYIGIDRTYLYKIFMVNKKVSPMQYLLTYRLQVASHLLRETEFSVSEIAYSCGFKDTPAFNKHFKKHYNATPTAFRKYQV